MLFLSSALVAGAAVAPVASRFVPEARWLEAVTAALPEKPTGWGAPATDRALWAKAAATIPAAELVAAALKEREQPVPELSDDLYLRYTRDGNRTDFQQANLRRMARLNLLAWAEGVEHQGRFLPALVQQVEAILAEKTWVLPAHDPKLNNFEGRWTEVDLMVAMKGWSLATIAYWHADQLPPELHNRIRAELKRRVIAPFLARVHGEKSADTDGMWWNQADNNWNAVCHAGVVGVALATLESRAERAEVIGFAALNLEYYLRGFAADGYCSEGIGYWNYGFGHFAMVSETLATATGGRVRPLSGDHAFRVAAYPAGFQILPGIYPAFADMDVKDRPSSWFGALAVRQGYPTPLGMKVWNLTVNDLKSLQTYEAAMKVFLPLATAGLPPAPAPRINANHYWFADAQVYTGRATPNFGAAIKGGHNAENHNHNDLGSFVVAAGDRAVLVDPGLEVYTKRTFGPDRYVSKVLSSYGHAVPVVAGQLQQPGREFAAKVISTAFSEKEDTVVLDLSGGYEVPALKSLVRTFTLRRAPKAEIIVRDTVEFSAPAAFETALITFEKWREKKPGRLTVGEGDSAVRVEVNVEGGSWKLRSELLQEDLPGKRQPTRLGLALDAPVLRATITVRIQPD
ncbi:Heparinase II/III-like protein [Lacunisphaera limnophila]|uniref:Heparinase II/III-like protein n=2 Tax=Lacunisphaera limnophila TaxID=1838286 RepID=A0A1D8ATX9_9BACT|nr:Heparinase II/III-like protein [Lacunisphaera limnophila]